MAMADVRIDMETALYEQMTTLCAKLGTTVEAMADGSVKSSCGWKRLPCLSSMLL